VPEFNKPFYTSNSLKVEADYVAGVGALQQGDFTTASRLFVNAAGAGHVSALYNLSLIWGGAM